MNIEIDNLKTAYVNHDYAVLKIDQARGLYATEPSTAHRNKIQAAVSEWSKAVVEVNKAERDLLETIRAEAIF